MKNGIARSPLFYVGDKYKLIREIKTHFPMNIGRLIEPFVGGGSVFINVDADEYLLNDINPSVIAIHQMLNRYIGRIDDFYREFVDIVDRYGLSLSYRANVVPDELKKTYPKTYYAKYNKEGYNRMKKDFNAGKQSDALVLYALLIYGFNRMLRFNKKGEFNLPPGDVDFNANTYEALSDYLTLLQNKKVNWSNLDFRDFLQGIVYQHDDLVYLDPPYLITFSEYNKLWNTETEQALLNMLDNLDRQDIRFAISNVTHYRGRTNDIFLRWSERYHSYPIKSNYISFNDNTIKQFNEVLVTNF